MVSLKQIEQAQARLAGHIVTTPLLESEWINERFGGRVLFKCECLQKTGSFKIRGATNMLLGLDPGLLKNGVVAYSSGNHAQGVAAAAQSLGVEATIVIPSDAPAMKLANTRAYGAEVVLYERDSESREEIAGAIARQKNAVIIPPYDDEAIIAGQASVGMEILQQLDCIPDAVLCPCGGGGLVAGVSSAIKLQYPGVEIFAVEPAGFDDTRRSLEAGQHVANEAGGKTICDAIVTPTPGQITFAINRELLQGVLVVDDDAVREAIITAFTRLKLVVEPGAAVGLAALISGAYSLQGKTLVVILSGGNMDISSLLQFQQQMQTSS